MKESGWYGRIALHCICEFYAHAHAVTAILDLGKGSWQHRTSSNCFHNNDMQHVARRFATSGERYPEGTRRMTLTESTGSRNKQRRLGAVERIA
jgi:hypothetical protein